MAQSKLGFDSHGLNIVSLKRYKGTKTNYDKKYDHTKRKRVFVPQWKVLLLWVANDEESDNMSCKPCRSESLQLKGKLSSDLFVIKFRICSCMTSYSHIKTLSSRKES